MQCVCKIVDKAKEHEMITIDRLNFSLGEVSDLHKDVYGYRPSLDWWSAWHNSSDALKQKTWDHMVSRLS